MSAPGTKAEQVERIEPAVVETVAAADATTVSGRSAESADETTPPRGLRQSRPGRIVAFGVLPAFLLLLGVAAGYLKYQFSTVVDGQSATISSVQAAKQGAITLLSYTPDTAQQTLTSARDLLTGGFRDDYTSLTKDVVIPESQQKRISATATVPAASSMSADGNHAVVLVFIDQTVMVGNDAPSATASAVQVTLDKVDNRWLISGFDPK